MLASMRPTKYDVLQCITPNWKQGKNRHDARVGFRYNLAKSQMTFGMIFSYAFQGQNHYFTASGGGGGGGDGRLQYRKDF